MSYEVSVFFREGGTEDDDTEVLEVAETIMGVRLPTLGKSRAVFGVHLEIGRTALGLRDTADQPFSAFRYQGDLSCPGGRVGIIHPIALSLAERWSLHFGDRSMVCLNGVEYLGAMFQNGRLIADHMGRHQELYIGSRWRYERE